MKNGFLLFITLGLLSACASTVKMVTDPIDAEIYAQRDSKSPMKQIGKTPLEVSSVDFLNLIGGPLQPGELLTLELRKSGFQTETIRLPAQRFGVLSTEINTHLKPEDPKDKNQAQEQMKSAQDILNRLFLAQKFALQKQYERAQIELDKIITAYPGFARALSMRGAIYYAQQNYPESLKAYEEALKQDPQMDETQKMTTKLRELIGSRKPAAAAGAP